MRSLEFKQVWGVLEKVGGVLNVLSSQEFAEGVDAVQVEAGQAVSEGYDVVEATVNLIKQILAIFQVSPEALTEGLAAEDGGRGLLTPFEMEVFNQIVIMR